MEKDTFVNDFGSFDKSVVFVDAISEGGDVSMIVQFGVCFHSACLDSSEPCRLQEPRQSTIRAGLSS